MLRIVPMEKAGEALAFFVYDSAKIMALLFLMIAGIGFLRTFLPQERMRQWLSAKGLLGNVLASVFGAVTPFCSCSSIPIFFGFLKAGVPLGVTFSFLITSPVINEYLVVLMFGFFGWKVTAAYVASGIIIGVIAGAALGRMRLERHIEQDILEVPAISCAADKADTFMRRVRFGVVEAGCTLKKLWVWILVGVGTGALIHNYVPQEAIQSVMQRTGVFSVPLATAIGVPLYGNCAAIVPVALALFQKGIPLGTALSFMMAVSALSFPEAVMLRRAMKLRLIGAFFGITTLAILIIGYLFNFLSKFLA